MAKIENATLKAECTRLCGLKKDKLAEPWTASESAIAIVRTVLSELGLKEELGDDYKEERKTITRAIMPLMTAPINFERTYLAAEGLMPVRAKGTKPAMENA